MDGRPAMMDGWPAGYDGWMATIHDGWMEEKGERHRNLEIPFLDQSVHQRQIESATSMNIYMFVLLFQGVSRPWAQGEGRRAKPPKSSV